LRNRADDAEADAARRPYKDGSFVVQHSPMSKQATCGRPGLSASSVEIGAGLFG